MSERRQNSNRSQADWLYSCCCCRDTDAMLLDIRLNTAAARGTNNDRYLGNNTDITSNDIKLGEY